MKNVMLGVFVLFLAITSSAQAETLLSNLDQARADAKPSPFTSGNGKAVDFTVGGTPQSRVRRKQGGVIDLGREADIHQEGPVVGPGRCAAAVGTDGIGHVEPGRGGIGLRQTTMLR